MKTRGVREGESKLSSTDRGKPNSPDTMLKTNWQPIHITCFFKTKVMKADAFTSRFHTKSIQLKDTFENTGLLKEKKYKSAVILPKTNDFVTNFRQYVEFMFLIHTFEFV